MSKRIQFSTTGGSEVLEWAEVEPVAPAAGEVRIANKAVGLNFIDIYFRTGLYPAPSMPSGLGTEGAGIVDAVGEGVTHLKVGDRVAYARARWVPTPSCTRCPRPRWSSYRISSTSKRRRPVC